LRGYAVKVELLTSSGDHLRYLPAALARAMVAAGYAEIVHQNGRVRSIRLLAAASSFARMIGPPSGTWAAPPFAVRERLEGGFAVWRHHGRATDYE
jgi:hypothetical protein